MDVREQNPTRLVLAASSGWLTYVSGAAALGFGLLLIFGGEGLESSNVVYKLIVGPIGVIAGLAMLLGSFQDVLIIDKGLAQLSIKKRYLLGLISRTNTIGLADISQFIVQHQTPFKLKTPALKFIFTSAGRKATFYSQNLHYGGKNSFFVQQAQTDAHNSDEEKLIPVVEGYIHLLATPQERGQDSSDTSKRLLFIGAYFVGGLVISLGLIWFYYHVIHTK